MIAINKWVQDVYHVEWLYNNNRVNKTEAIIWLCVLCIVFACFAPIVFICVVAFIDAVLKKLDQAFKSSAFKNLDKKKEFKKCKKALPKEICAGRDLGY